MKNNAFLATGRRKNSIARVRLMIGEGKIVVNGREPKEYFGAETLLLTINQPLVVTNSAKKYDIVATLTGGGISGQAGALRHGISRALVKADEDNKKVLKENGFLTRDARMKERKKFGLKKARKASQFSKR